MWTTETIESLVLKDGSQVTIRAIRPDDAPRLQALHARLSEESLQFRFLGHRRTLPDEQAKYQANIDFKTTMALVATIPDNDQEQVVGVARYALIPSRKPKQAEAAIVVQDKYQRLGLGIMLSDRLVACAQSHRIYAFVSFIDPENMGVVHLIRRCGLEYQVVGRDTESLEIQIDITPSKKSHGRDPN